MKTIRIRQCIKAMDTGISEVEMQLEKLRASRNRMAEVLEEAEMLEAVEQDEEMELAA